jgi:hypothetical protein
MKTKTKRTAAKKKVGEGSTRTAYKDTPPVEDEEGSQHSGNTEITVDYEDVVDEAATADPKEASRKGRAMFTRDEEQHINTFLKNRPRLYKTRAPDYLTKTQKAQRLDVWKELELDMPSCTPEKLETWYWSTRTLYGKQLNRPPRAPLPGQRPNRAQYLMDAWFFHKPYIQVKTVKTSNQQQEEPTLMSPTPGPSTAPPSTRRSDSEDSSEDNDDNNAPSSTRKKPRTGEVVHDRTDTLADCIASHVEHTLMDPEEKGRKMIMDGTFLEVLRRLPVKLWVEFQDEYQQLISTYRRKLMHHDEGHQLQKDKEPAVPVPSFVQQAPTQQFQQAYQLPQQQAYQTQQQQGQQGQQATLVMPSYLQTLQNFPPS